MTNASLIPRWAEFRQESRVIRNLQQTDFGLTYLQLVLMQINVLISQYSQYLDSKLSAMPTSVKISSRIIRTWAEVYRLV